jgi:hypothetical protein
MFINVAIPKLVVRLPLFKRLADVCNNNNNNNNNRLEIWVDAEWTSIAQLCHHFSKKYCQNWILG